jgi:hypothetical protein
MIVVRIGSREMMTMFRCFKTLPVVCLWLGILSEFTSLAKFEKENTYSFVGASERMRF